MVEGVALHIVRERPSLPRQAFHTGCSLRSSHRSELFGPADVNIRIADGLLIFRDIQLRRLSAKSKDGGVGPAWPRKLRCVIVHGTRLRGPEPA